MGNNLLDTFEESPIHWRIITLCIMAIILLLLGYYIGVSRPTQQAKQLKLHQTELKGRYTFKIKRLNKIHQQAATLKIDRKNYAALATRWLGNTTPHQLLESLQQRAKENKLQLLSFKPGMQKTLNDYPVISVSFSLKGQYAPIVRTLSVLTSTKPLLLITGIDVAPSVSDKTALTLKANALLFNKEPLDNAPQS